MFLKDKTVLITGGSRGIGRAIALRLAREQPAHIMIGYCMNHSAARQTVSEIEALGVPASMISADVRQHECLREMFDEARQRLGRLDVFISNAARTTFRPAMELNVRNWQKVMDINARSFLLGSQMAAEIMRENGGGKIVGISSLGSQYYIPHYTGLGVAKAAMEALARYLAVELAPWKINVNIVCGGFIDTQTMRMVPSYDDLARNIINHTPAKRLGKEDDIAGVVAFLCSPESDWIRGQTLVADGGYSLVLWEDYDLWESSTVKLPS
jgi:enoyl-[acyl-carrier protein] reductase III